MRFAVLGAGSAGQGLMSFLSLRGFDVALFDPPLHAEQLMLIVKKLTTAVFGVVGGKTRLVHSLRAIQEIEHKADAASTTLRAFSTKQYLA
jgi:3-hydroxyacyl-CoA dehydrogenase